MTNYKVVEIFSSINGEGTRAGQLAVFVRMQGCNLNCTYCDTKWANEADAKFHWTSTEEILELLRSMEIKNVTITGGGTTASGRDRRIIGSNGKRGEPAG